MLSIIIQKHSANIFIEYLCLGTVLTLFNLIQIIKIWTVDKPYFPVLKSPACFPIKSSTHRRFL